MRRGRLLALSVVLAALISAVVGTLDVLIILLLTERFGVIRTAIALLIVFYVYALNDG